MYVVTRLDGDDAQVQRPIMGYGHSLGLTAALTQFISRWVLNTLLSSETNWNLEGDGSPRETRGESLDVGVSDPQNNNIQKKHKTVLYYIKDLII